MKNHMKMFLVYISLTNLFKINSIKLFDKINRFTRVFDGTRYLILFRSEKYNSIYNRIIYLK